MLAQMLPVQSYYLPIFALGFLDFVNIKPENKTKKQ